MVCAYLSTGLLRDTEHSAEEAKAMALAGIGHRPGSEYIIVHKFCNSRSMLPHHWGSSFGVPTSVCKGQHTASSEPAPFVDEMPSVQRLRSDGNARRPKTPMPQGLCWKRISDCVWLGISVHRYYRPPGTANPPHALWVGVTRCVASGLSI